MIIGLDGHQAGDKIKAGLTDNAIGGCILNPRYRQPQNLTDTALDLAKQYPDSLRMIDPCSYNITLPPSVLGSKYQRYPFGFNGLNRRGLRGLDLSEYAFACLDFQVRLNVSALVGPGIPMETFEDFRSELTLEAFRASINICQSEEVLRGLPILHSLSFRESALSSFEAVCDYLDLLTQVEGDGFYIVVSRDVITDPQWGEASRIDRLTNLLYLVYALSVNEYRIVYSYSDMVGLLVLASGGTDIATGWFGTTRQMFCDGTSQSGGQQPRPLYTSYPLLSQLLMAPDVAALMAAGFTDRVIDSVGFDDRIKRDGAGTEWSKRTEILHFWHVLTAIADEILAIPTVEDRVGHLQVLIGKAISICLQAQEEGVRIEKRPYHLSAWLQTLQNFNSLITQREES